MKKTRGDIFEKTKRGSGLYRRQMYRMQQMYFRLPNDWGEYCGKGGWIELCNGGR